MENKKEIFNMKASKNSPLQTFINCIYANIFDYRYLPKLMNKKSQSKILTLPHFLQSFNSETA